MGGGTVWFLISRGRRVCTGVDLGTHEIKVVRMALNGTEPVVLGCSAVPAPRFSYAEGLVQAEMMAALEEALRAAGSAKDAEVLVAAVGGGRVITRNIVIPAMPGKDFKAAVRWEAERHLPVPPEELVIKHVNLGKIVTGGAAHVHVLLVGVSRKLVQEYRTLFRETGRVLTALDLQALALWRLFFGSGPERAGGQEAVALVDIGAGHTEFVVVRDGCFQYCRSLAGGAGSLTGAVRPFAGTGPAVKNAYGDRSKVQAAGEACWGEEAGPEYGVRAGGGGLTANIRRSIDWYQSRNWGQRVARVVLSGGGSGNAGLAGYLGGQLRLPVDAGRVRLSLPAAVEGGFDRKFAVAAGLALRELVR